MTLNDFSPRMNNIFFQEYYPLQSLTTFNIGGAARYFVEIHSVAELLNVTEIAEIWQSNLFILGGGSNVLVSDRGFDGLVVKMNLRGIAIGEEDAASVLLHVAAGECWDAVVAQAVSAGWWGIENLSHIPGSAGALPIQNVGAYGQEASDAIEYVEVYERNTRQIIRLNRQMCEFAYRASLFNSTMKDQYMILSIGLRLKKQGIPNLRYPDLQAIFNDHTSHPSLQEIRDAVIAIRSRKLPDPEQLGNAGSFFKNLSLSDREYEELYRRIQSKFGGNVLSKLEQFKRTFSGPAGIKLPTAFLLDMCGLKGLRIGNVALSEKNPLVVVNLTGNATAHEVMTFARTVRHAVYAATGVAIVPEPNLIGFSPEELKHYFGLTKP